MKLPKEKFIPWFIHKRFGHRSEYIENSSLYKGRQTGKTTRLADKYIQELFTTGHIKITDHIDSVDTNDRLFRIIHHRILTEHSHIVDMLNIRRNEIVFKDLDQ